MIDPHGIVDLFGTVMLIRRHRCFRSKSIQRESRSVPFVCITRCNFTIFPSTARDGCNQASNVSGPIRHGSPRERRCEAALPGSAATAAGSALERCFKHLI